MDRNKAFSILEEMVDAYGVSGVLEILATVAGEKADHVRTNWQDEKLAKVWEGVATKASKLSATLSV